MNMKIYEISTSQILQYIQIMHQIEFSRDWAPDSIFGNQSVLSTRLKSKEEEEKILISMKKDKV